MTLYLHGLGHFHPENEIDNAFLESLDIGTDNEWILERVGIRSRRTVLPLDYIRGTRNADVRAAAEASLYTAAQVGARAAEMAISRSGIDKAEIGMVIAGSSMPDYATPAEACNIARELGLDVPAFDVNSACTSFLMQIRVLSMMRPEALPPYVLIVVPECATKVVDYNDRATAVLWGDGGAAAVVSARVRGPARLLGATAASNPAGADKVVVPRTGHFTQDGRAVQMFAVRKTAEVFEHLRDQFAENARNLHFVGHQANLRMLEAVCQRCEISAERHHSNVEWFGNTAAASSASVISTRWDEWREKDDVAVVGVGGGLTWAGYLIRFDAAPDEARAKQSSLEENVTEHGGAAQSRPLESR
ncbi:MAG TPA: ketoacyl-ACP synthase III [Vicinamibacterales bacterium]|nr:ketoacyl-ACP synthase III [Vicinamibacterales bacterium]